MGIAAGGAGWNAAGAIMIAAIVKIAIADAQAIVLGLSRVALFNGSRFSGNGKWILPL